MRTQYSSVLLNTSNKSRDVMDSVRIVEYNGHEIRVFAWLPPREANFTALYEIRSIADPLASVQRGKVAGALAHVEEAHAAALDGAKKRINEKTSKNNADEA